ncbi:MAG TPA: primosomal protein N' [Thermodesulfobacteriota bacterium]|mgnify:CR=1 FL=1|nr:primosomal protein N' [Deltaproteobacteria bacterium]HNR13279.1 primosomal protein N' [Thermodesulfobacteriota bacterium]HOC38059.1 primosomal protein N' [Thermodesulfobacteriota bacterium]
MHSGHDQSEIILAEVAPAVPLTKTLHYIIPESLSGCLAVGSRVLVPLGQRMVTGYVVAVFGASAAGDLKYIEQVLDRYPLFTPAELTFFLWISSYYCSPLGEVIKQALPAGINLATVKHVCVTPQGEACFREGRAPAEALDLLRLLAGKRCVPLSSLKKMHSTASLNSLISWLLDTSLISCVQTQRRQPVQVRREKMFHLNAEILSTLSCGQWKQLRRRAPSQFTIMKWLYRKEVATQRDVQAQWGRKSQSILRLLEKKGFLTTSAREMYRVPVSGDAYGHGATFELTTDQEAALQQIIPAIHKNAYAAFLLHGVTGSGKTEVYLRAISEAIRTGRSAIVLVPEISLTPQLIGIFMARFGNRVAQVHSGLSQGERFDEWRRIKNGEATIVIGARSAIFAPVKDLGIIVVDEEHDAAYKQDSRVRYNARDLALVRGTMNQSVVVLGSATPMVETYYNAQTGKLRYLMLSSRVDNRQLPQVEVVDMRTEPPGTMVSSALREAIRARLQAGQQTLLFLNRRGFARFVLCRQCSFTFRCAHCAVSLVYHQQERRLRCHYCGYGQKLPAVCPDCGSSKLSVMGFGTERLETEMHKLFPGIRVARLDRDTVARRNALFTILKRFRQGETDVLIGTQMIALGHDLPKVTLVGIVAADASLNFPDFRANERSFHLFTQVAGRSGRGEIPGQVIIQTYNPSCSSIQMAVKHDYHEFVKQELEQRLDLNYPPFARMVNVRMAGNDAELTAAYALEVGNGCRKLLEEDSMVAGTVEILGPAEAPWEKLQGKYRWQMLFKSGNRQVLHRFTKKVIESLAPRTRRSGVSMSIDIDPVNLL